MLGKTQFNTKVDNTCKHFEIEPLCYFPCSLAEAHEKKSYPVTEIIINSELWKSVSFFLFKTQSVAKLLFKPVAVCYISFLKQF